MKILGYWCNGSTRVTAKTMEAAVKRERVQFPHTLSISPRSAGFVEGLVYRTSRASDGNLEPGRGGRNAPRMRDSRRDGVDLQRMVCREILQRVTRMVGWTF